MRVIGLFAGALLAAPTGANLVAQDANIRLPAARAETLLRDSSFRPVAQEGSRFKGDRTQHVLLMFGDTTAIEVVDHALIAPHGDVLVDGFHEHAVAGGIEGAVE